MRAVILLSGGLDSCVSATLAKDRCKDLFALSFVYGQKHKKEMESARKIGRYLKVKEHKFITIDPNLFSTSSLVNKDLSIEERNVDEIGKDIPSTYVHARNTIFLSYALAFAESRDADFIYIGVNALDYSGYPDCRPEYLEAFQKMADLALKRSVEGRPIKIKAPLLYLSKAEIVKKGIIHIPEGRKIFAPLTVYENLEISMEDSSICLKRREQKSRRNCRRRINSMRIMTIRAFYMTRCPQWILCRIMYPYGLPDRVPGRFVEFPLNI